MIFFQKARKSFRKDFSFPAARKILSEGFFIPGREKKIITLPWAAGLAAKNPSGRIFHPQPRKNNPNTALAAPQAEARISPKRKTLIHGGAKNPSARKILPGSAPLREKKIHTPPWAAGRAAKYPVDRIFRSQPRKRNPATALAALSWPPGRGPESCQSANH